MNHKSRPRNDKLVYVVFSRQKGYTDRYKKLLHRQIKVNPVPSQIRKVSIVPPGNTQPGGEKKVCNCQKSNRTIKSIYQQHKWGN